MDGLKAVFTADTTDLVAKVNAAADKVNASVATISSAVDVAKNAFIGFIGVASVGAFASMVNGAINATASLKDLAQQTGMSEAALGAFRGVAGLSETSIETVASATNKLSKGLIANSEDGKMAGSALKAMGLEFGEFTKLNPDERMIAVANAMSGYADGADKSAAAQALFGKSGAELIPFLSDLAEKSGAITAKLTDQEVALRANQAAMADAFGDNLTEIKKNGESWKKELSLGILPALWEMSEAYKTVEKSGGGLKGSISELAKDGSITSWSRAAVTGATYVLDAFEGLKAVVTSVGKVVGANLAIAGAQITGVATAVSKAVNGDFKGAMDAMEESQRAQSAITKDLKTDLDATWGKTTLGQNLRDRMKDLRETGIEAQETKPKMDMVSVLDANKKALEAQKNAQKEAEKAAREHAAEIKKQEDAYIALTSKLSANLSEMNAEITGIGKLTPAQKEQIKILEDLRTGRLKLNPEQAAAIVAMSQEAIEQEKLVTQHRNDEEQIKKNTIANADFLDKQYAITLGIEAQITQVKDHTSKLGLNKEELVLLSAQKDIDTAATLEQKAAWAEQNSLGSDLVTQYKNQAEGLRTLAGLKQQGIHVQAAVDAQNAWQKTTDSIANGLGEALASAVIKGKLEWASLRDAMVRIIIDGALKNAITSVFSEAFSGVGGMLSSVIGGIKSSIGSAIGSAVGLPSGSSLISSAASALGLGGTGSGAAVAGGIAATGGGVAASTTAGTLAGGGALGAAGDFGLVASGGGAATSTAAASGSILSGSMMTGLGVLAAPIVLGMLLSGTRSVWDDAGQKQTLQGTYTGTQYTYQGSGENTSLAAIDYKDATLQVQPQIEPATGNLRYIVMDSDGRQLADVGDLGQLQSALPGFVPKFAAGGLHDGGVRLVGENGPELEVTGPSRIIDAQRTAQLFSGDGSRSLSDNADILRELKLLREVMEINTEHAESQADTLKGRNQQAPLRVTVVTV